MNAKVFLSSSTKGTAGNGAARAELKDGSRWEVEPILQDYDVRSLASDPIHKDVVYAGTQGRGILRSEDRGKTWRAAGLEGKIVKSMAVSPHDSGKLYAGTNPARVYVSHDSGDSWIELESFRRIPGRWWWFSPAEKPYTAYVSAIALSPETPDVILAGIELGGVVRSRDGGETWSGHRKGALRDCHSLIFHSTDGRLAYEAGGSGGGAASSRDGGKTWSKMKVGLDRNYGVTCAADPLQSGIWYLSVSPGPQYAHSWDDARAHIYRSVRGEPWHRLSGGLPQPMDHMPYSLLVDPDAPGHIYAGLSSGAIWHSPDHGESWSQLEVDLRGIWRQLLMLT